MSKDEALEKYKKFLSENDDRFGLHQEMLRRLESDKFLQMAIGSLAKDYYELLENKRG